MDDSYEVSREDLTTAMDVALCIVCDIRSFTEMQTRVHDLIFESLESEELKNFVRKKHRDYVQETQIMAYNKLTEPVVEWEKKYEKNLQYVIKPTGDGYMIAVPMAYDNGDRQAHMELAGALIRSAYSLTLESDIKFASGFGALTRSFLQSCGDALGFSEANIHNEGVRFDERTKGKRDFIINTRFRVAAAASLGFATFVEAPDVDPKAKGLEKYLPQLRDVSGYGINLAFRLCDQAGRGYEDGRCISPPMLLDRRIGRALEAHNREKYKSEEAPYCVRPWWEQLRLRGFEERWAYYLVRNGSTTVPHAL